MLPAWACSACLEGSKFSQWKGTRTQPRMGPWGFRQRKELDQRPGWLKIPIEESDVIGQMSTMLGKRQMEDLVFVLKGSFCSYPTSTTRIIPSSSSRKKVGHDDNA